MIRRIFWLLPIAFIIFIVSLVSHKRWQYAFVPEGPHAGQVGKVVSLYPFDVIVTLNLEGPDEKREWETFWFWDVEKREKNH